MITQYLPGLIMFGVTVAFVSLCFFPAAVYPRKNATLNFYWFGLWVLMGVIAAVSGAKQTLRGFDYDAALFTDTLLFVVGSLFVFFVVFAWFRLSAGAIFYGFKKLFKARA